MFFKVKELRIGSAQAARSAAARGQQQSRASTGTCQLAHDRQEESFRSGLTWGREPPPSPALSHGTSLLKRLLASHAKAPLWSQGRSLKPQAKSTSRTHPLEAKEPQLSFLLSKRGLPGR